MIYLKIVSVISPLLLILICWRMRFTLLWLYAATGFFIDLVSILLKYVLHTNNLWLGNVFVLAEFLFISFYYKKALYRNANLFFGITAIFAFYFIFNTTNKSLFDFNTFGAGIFCILYVIYGLLGFYSQLKQAKPEVLGNSPFFWVNTAIFIYASGTFLLFLFRYYLQEKDLDLFNTIWQTFFPIINIMRYLLIGFALFKTKRT